MTATSTPDRTDPTRSGAVWVTGTGAFLLLAAAAVFTAVRWDQIPASVKLGALGLATGGFLLAGRHLAKSLPATGAALFHLGTFLVPIDVAAIGIRTGVHWSTLLLAEGVAATLTFAWAAATERSVVLRWAWGAAVVVLAGGIGATTAMPPVVVLAACAATAALLRANTPALGWAAVVGLAPLATLVDDGLTIGSDTFARLGLASSGEPVVAALAAVAAAGVIGVVAQRRAQVDLALVSVIVGLVGVGSAWISTSPAATSTGVALAAAFVGVELLALALRGDPFWQSPSSLVASASERAGVLGLAVLVLEANPFGTGYEVDASLAASSALLAVAWIVADRRRGEAGMFASTVAVAASALAAVAFGTDSHLVLSGALAAVAVAAVLADRQDVVVAAGLAACAAPLVAWGEPVAVATGLVGAFALGECAVRRSRTTAEPPRTQRMVEDAAQGLTLLSLVPIGLVALAQAGSADQVGTGTRAVVMLVLAAAATSLLAAWIDRGADASGLPLGTLVRAGTAAVLAGTAELTPGQVAVVAVAVAVLSIVDAVRLQQPAIALGAALAGPIALGAFVRSTGLSLPTTGVALTLGAVVIAGLGSLLGREWHLPCGAAVALSLAGGVALAQPEPVAFAHALLISGGLGLAIGVVLARLEVQAVSAAVITMGFWLRLSAEGVTASEPYLVPVVGLLLVAGARALAKGTANSWIAFGPAIALLGGSALTERVQGGAGWHAVVAGAVGVAAVAVGGDRRLAAPLVLGTTLLVVLSGYETLAITAGLPTWSWLALGGGTLLGAGVAMERHEVGPLETGRRLVDVVSERYR